MFNEIELRAANTKRLFKKALVVIVFVVGYQGLGTGSTDNFGTSLPQESIALKVDGVASDDAGDAFSLSFTIDINLGKSINNIIKCWLNT